MDISNINGISTGDIKSFFNNTSLTKTDKTDSFSDVLSAAMGSIGETNDLQNAAEQEEVRFALGESDNTHDLLVAETHTYLIRAVCDSFSVVPLGGAQFQFDNMLSTMTKYMGDMFVIGFRIFLPVFACMMIMNCILGIMAKVAPQMNMFSVGIQLKIIAGFIVLFLIVYLIPNIANFIITEIKTMVVSIIDGMY